MEFKKEEIEDMSTCSNTIYVDEERVFKDYLGQYWFHDKTSEQFSLRKIYQGDDDKFYADENHTVELKICCSRRSLEHFGWERSGGTSSFMTERPPCPLNDSMTADDIAGSPETAKTFTQSSADMEVAEHLSADETRFFIDLIKDHLCSTGGDWPRSIGELESRMKFAKGKKKFLWQSTSQRMTKRFGKVFAPAKLKRKWQTLQDAFKKASKTNSSTGRTTSKFAFFKEMSALIGGNHDVSFTMSRDVTISPSPSIECDLSSPRTPCDPAKPLSYPSPTTSSTPATPRSSTSSGSTSPSPSRTSRSRRKRKRLEDVFLASLKASDDALYSSQRQILQQMQRMQESTERMFMALLARMEPPRLQTQSGNNPGTSNGT